MTSTQYAVYADPDTEHHASAVFSPHALDDGTEPWLAEAGA